MDLLVATYNLYSVFLSSTVRRIGRAGGAFSNRDVKELSKSVGQILAFIVRSGFVDDVKPEAVDNGLLSRIREFRPLSKVSSDDVICLSHGIIESVFVAYTVKKNLFANGSWMS